MSDFFASLLDRAEQRAAVLQWRRPSMFENAPAAAIPSPTPESGMEITRPVARPETNLPTPSGAVLKPSATANPTPLAPPVQHSINPVAPAAATPPAALAPSPSINTIVNQHIHHHAPAMPQSAPSVMPVQEHQTIRETRVEHKVLLPALSKPAEPAPSNSLKPAKPHANPPMPAPASQVRSTEKIRTIRMPAPAAKASAALQPRLTPRPNPVASIASPASASTARRTEVARRFKCRLAASKSKPTRAPLHHAAPAVARTGQK